MQCETERNREADRGEQIGSTDKPNGRSVELQWQVAQPYNGFGKEMENMLISLSHIITGQVRIMEKDLKKIKKMQG